MFSDLILIIGMLIFLVTIFLLKKEVQLYKNGEIKTVKLVRWEPYNYQVITPEKEKGYIVGINPVFEVEEENKIIKMDYVYYDEYKDLKIGDETAVIYPKGKIVDVMRYSKYRLFKKSALSGVISILIIIISIVIR